LNKSHLGQRERLNVQRHKECFHNVFGSSIGSDLVDLVRRGRIRAKEFDLYDRRKSRARCEN
jgi:hypothetical protein